MLFSIVQVASNYSIHCEFYFILLNVLRPKTFLRTHSWLNWVDEDDDEDEVGLIEKPEDTIYIKKITSK